MFPHRTNHRNIIVSVVDKLDFSDWLSQEMANRGWSQSDLAAVADVNRASISHIIKRSRLPGPDLLVKIAKALKYPPEDIFRIAGLLPADGEKKGDKEDPPGLGEWVWHYLQADEEERNELLEFARFKAQDRNAKASEFR